MRARRFLIFSVYQLRTHRTRRPLGFVHVCPRATLRILPIASVFWAVIRNKLPINPNRQPVSDEAVRACMLRRWGNSWRVCTCTCPPPLWLFTLSSKWVCLIHPRLPSLPNPPESSWRCSLISSHRALLTPSVVTCIFPTPSSTIASAQMTRTAPVCHWWCAHQRGVKPGLWPGPPSRFTQVFGFFRFSMYPLLFATTWHHRLCYDEANPRHLRDLGTPPLLYQELSD